METLRFTVPGNPVGYYAQAGRNKWRMSPDQRARVEKYREYQQFVAECATAAGVSLPLNADKTHQYVIDVMPYFRNGTHCDPGNVQKGVVDALFYGGSGDKHTGGRFPWPLYDKARPRVEVCIHRSAFWADAGTKKAV